MIDPQARAVQSRAAIETLLAHLREWIPAGVKMTTTRTGQLAIPHPISGVGNSVKICPVTGAVSTRRGDFPNFTNVVELYRHLYESGYRLNPLTDTYAAIQRRFEGLL